VHTLTRSFLFVGQTVIAFSTEEYDRTLVTKKTQKKIRQ